tara:strand:- start:351 stop:908 length:558 start_codon:yes stop_codon:yes gene_type:complete
MDLLKELPNMLSYDKKTGALQWKTLPERLFSHERYCRAWNKVYAGKPAFTTRHSAGYFHSSIRGKQYLAHRIIWAIQTGEWPDGQIDHINGDRSDNRWENLRVVSHAENMRNMKISHQNKSGYVGVFWNEANKKWRADICKDGITHRLGEFTQKVDAIAARASAERRLGFHKNHGRAPTKDQTND